MSNPRIIMVTGKGGVGKTTVALSTAASIEGARLIQLEESSGPDAGVERLVLNSDDCVERAASKLLGSKRIARMLLGRASVQALLRLSDAVKVIAVLERIRELRLEGRPLVLDMPATGHALAWFRSVQVFSKLTRRGAAYDVVSRIAREVLDPSAIEVWVVSIPTPVALAETEELSAALREQMGIDVRLIINRDEPPGSNRPSRAASIPHRSAVRRLPEFSQVSIDEVGRLLGVAA